MYSVSLRTARPSTPGRCVVCRGPLGGDVHGYWITSHPDGVHHSCRRWEEEPFPFDADLDRLRRIARLLQRAWREIVSDGRWLSSARRAWPAQARRRATEWLERKARLEHHLALLRDRLRF